MTKNIREDLGRVLLEKLKKPAKILSVTEDKSRAQGTSRPADEGVGRVRIVDLELGHTYDILCGKQFELPNA